MFNERLPGPLSLVSTCSVSLRRGRVALPSVPSERGPGDLGRAVTAPFPCPAPRWGCRPRLKCHFKRVQAHSDPSLHRSHLKTVQGHDMGSSIRSQNSRGHSFSKKGHALVLYLVLVSEAPVPLGRGLRWCPPEDPQLQGQGEE